MCQTRVRRDDAEKAKFAGFRNPAGKRYPVLQAEQELSRGSPIRQIKKPARGAGFGMSMGSYQTVSAFTRWARRETFREAVLA